jgi:hypothetical protein
MLRISHCLDNRFTDGGEVNLARSKYKSDLLITAWGNQLSNNLHLACTYVSLPRIYPVPFYRDLFLARSDAVLIAGSATLYDMCAYSHVVNSSTNRFCSLTAIHHPHHRQACRSCVWPSICELNSNCSTVSTAALGTCLLPRVVHMGQSSSCCGLNSPSINFLSLFSWMLFNDAISMKTIKRRWHDDKWKWNRWTNDSRQ